MSVISKVLTAALYRIGATDLLVKMQGKIHEAVLQATYVANEAVAEVDEAMSHIPNGLTPMSESDWEETTPADQHIYMVFPDEQVESES